MAVIARHGKFQEALEGTKLPHFRVMLMFRISDQMAVSRHNQIPGVSHEGEFEVRGKHVFRKTAPERTRAFVDSKSLPAIGSKMIDPNANFREQPIHQVLPMVVTIRPKSTLNAPTGGLGDVNKNKPMRVRNNHALGNLLLQGTLHHREIGRRDCVGTFFHSQRASSRKERE